MLDLTTLSDRQREGLQILNDPDLTRVQFYGGARSGKTHVLVAWIIMRALVYPGSRHLIARYARAKAKQTIWQQTLLPMIKPLVKEGVCTVRQSSDNLSVLFKGGGYILIEGLEPARLDGVLGAEYATVYVNEANENKWKAIELLFSRLNDTSKRSDGRQIVPKFVCDLNPTTRMEWPYVYFHEKSDPESPDPNERIPVKNPRNLATLWFHPKDNTENLAGGFLRSLEAGSEAFRRRFLYGEFGDLEGRIFPQPTRAEWANMRSVVAYLDPAWGGGNNTALAIGGKYRGKLRGCVRGYAWTDSVVNKYREIAARCELWNVGTLYVEANKDEGACARDLKKYWPAVQAIKVHKNKHIRIVRWLLERWNLLDFALDCDSSFLHGVLDYQEGEEPDDEADALAGLVEKLGLGRSTVGAILGEQTTMSDF